MPKWTLATQPASPYFEIMRSPHLSTGVYRLQASAQDLQSPHSEDELYYVTRGRARFSAGHQDSSVAPGDLLFVPAGQPHRFHSIEEDLELLVVFAPAEGSRSAA
ncbi:MAG: cupin domain-containing protein [Bryobacteraceae bacterium]